VFARIYRLTHDARASLLHPQGREGKGRDLWIEIFPDSVALPVQLHLLLMLDAADAAATAAVNCFTLEFYG